MFDKIIKFSLNNRILVLGISVFLLIYGFYELNKMPIDVFPDLNRPRVTVVTEAHGLAPEEVETMVTQPLESTLNGAPGVIQVRSSSGIGISLIYVEFDWDTNIKENRQLVAERLQLAKSNLPEEVTPAIGPITSIMGEIQFLGLQSESKEITPIKLRTIADTLIRPRLMTIPGISQIVVMGGGVKQYHILLNSKKLAQFDVTIDEIKDKISHISVNTTGGFLDIEKSEYLVRALSRASSIGDIENTFVAKKNGKNVLLKDLGKIEIGVKEKRGEASINGKHSVVLTIQKQPKANTVELTEKIDELVIELRKTLPPGVTLKEDLFKQSKFIENSIWNVKEALRDGAIMIAIVLFLFLMNFRTTAITLTAIPLSILLSALVFKLFGLSINTMTLGGLAIAIGELVDDAIVDVENVLRRLKENQGKGNPVNPLKVIFLASKEIRNSIVFSTLIVVLVFIPLFAMSGIEGRLFSPLGVAYIVSLLSSLLVALTVTPVLCYYFLSKSNIIEKEEDGWLVRKLKSIDKAVLLKLIDKPFTVLGGSFVILVLSLLLVPKMGVDFLPKFNEGTATIGISLTPGVSLKESDKFGNQVENILLKIPEVKSTVRRTGRAEMDEHAEGVFWSEIDVDFHEKGREREVVLAEIREKLGKLGTDYLNVGQPISHRLDHMLSGVRSQIAIKIFGSDLATLRQIGRDIESKMRNIEGITDLQLEPLIEVPQVKVKIDSEYAADEGLVAGDIAESVEVGMTGYKVSNLVEDQSIYDIVLKYDDETTKTIDGIKNIFVKNENDKDVFLQDIADVYKGKGPNAINREDMRRRIIVQANSVGRDLNSVAKDINKILREEIKLPEGYFVDFGGRFESQQKASRLITFLGLLSLLLIVLVLYIQFKSFPVVLQILINIPLALIGSIVAIYLTEKTISLASLVAFITLCGIASRNGIMMISHYIHLVKEEGHKFNKEMVIQGSLERLVPVLMTAFTAVLALSPLLLSKGEPGKEILYPVAVVIVGGLISSTLMDIIVTPVVFYKFGKSSVEKKLNKKMNNNNYSL